MPTHDTLAAALAAAQAEFPKIPRTRTVTVRTKSGGSYAFKYATLDDVLTATIPVLSNHGLAVVQPLNFTDHGDAVLETIVLHATTDQRLTSRFPLNLVGLDPQDTGSLITYMRRYTFVSMLGLAPDDDDDAQSAAASPQDRSGSLAAGSDDQPHAEQSRRPTQAETDTLIALVEELMGLDAITIDQLQRRSGINLPWPDLAESLDADITLDLTERLRGYRDAVVETMERRAAEEAATDAGT